MKRVKLALSGVSLSRSPETNAIHNLILIDRQLSSFALLDSKNVKAAPVLHAALGRLQKCLVFVHTPPMAPTICPAGLVMNVGFSRRGGRWWRWCSASQPLPLFPLRRCIRSPMGQGPGSHLLTSVQQHITGPDLTICPSVQVHTRISG